MEYAIQIMRLESGGTAKRVRGYSKDIKSEFSKHFVNEGSVA